MKKHLKCEVSGQYAKDNNKTLHFYCEFCGKEMGYDEDRICFARNKEKCLGCNTLPDDNPFHTCNNHPAGDDPKGQKLEEEFDKIYESGFYIRNKLKDFIHTNYIPREEMNELLKGTNIRINIKKT